MMEVGLQVWHTGVFADGIGGGNPCPVILGASGLRADQMQAVARHFGQECGFVVSEEEDEVLALRYFVPNHEMSMCVHATAATVAVQHALGRFSHSTATVQTPIGSLLVRLDHRGDRPRVAVEQLPPTYFDADRPPRDEVCDVLRIDPSKLGPAGLPVESVSVSRPKLIVPLFSPEVLNRLEPDFPALQQLCDRYDTTGLYPFAFGSDHLEARQFPASSGYAEDAATGVAAGALAAYARRHVAGFDGDRWTRIRQGRAMARPSLIEARTIRTDDDLRVEVRGEVTIGSSELLGPDDLVRSAP